MCGIAGIVHLEAQRGPCDLRKRLSAMTEALIHRGPDDGGIFLSPDGSVGLGNRRLAIRDLSPAGHMPMGNAGGTLWITYNGEIYNAGELRSELERKGYRFRSTSDTEVILHGYAAWGEEVVHRLRGMFAFAIYDARGRRGDRSDGETGRATDRAFSPRLPVAQVPPSPPPTGPRLFLARDRLGVKPLYYVRTGDTFLFASELKAIQASGQVSREVSPGGVIGYLMLGAVPNPLTIYRDIRALEPASTLTVALEDAGATISSTRYWSLPTDTVEPSGCGEAVEQVRALLEEAVRIRMVSDVPLGAFLSGGLDSSAIVALMRKATDGPIRTCSLVFEEAEYSEAPYARAMAKAAGTEHHERLITARDLCDELDHILAAMDQPSIDGFNTYFVSQTARQAGLTVALSGLGADELFGGYPNTFQGVPQMLRALKLAHSVPGGALLARSAIRLLPQHQRWARVQEALTHPVTPASAYLTRRGLFAPDEVRALVPGDLWYEGIKGFDPLRHIAERADNGAHANGYFDAFAWTSRAELRTYTHHQLLGDTDAMSMAQSLEVRVPFLDHRLVEAVLRLPDRLKEPHNGDGAKSLLVKAVSDLLPPAVLDRPRKQGFTLPFDPWMPEFRRRSNGPSTLGNGQDGILDAGAAERAWMLHGAGKMHWSRPWALFVLDHWLRSAR